HPERSGNYGVRAAREGLHRLGTRSISFKIRSLTFLLKYSIIGVILIRNWSRHERSDQHPASRHFLGSACGSFASRGPVAPGAIRPEGISGIEKALEYPG